ncbi:hypothetical protein [Flectobacillus rivi]|uniref:Uncharacterized protein n=1 Tax=Flectobacillus rivi TaxID=2984209 RepID=A0ABT6YZD3_9BACT|nr:hypothetical protein [Flectobacillus rivi]MDI9874236.1 hypothetical protein [Flectobacillus rivi]
MERNFAKDFIEIASEFKRAKPSKDSIIKMYDLLYDLESATRTKNDDITLANVYSMLGCHLSAYKVLKSVADLSDKKVVAKLYVMEEKSQSHGNRYIIKDFRKKQQEKILSKLLPTDFVASETEENHYHITSKEIYIFDKIIEKDTTSISLCGGSQFDTYAEKIIDFIFWLGTCKKELIKFYNKNMSDFSGDEANGEWYHTLDIYNVNIGVAENGKLGAEISVGDIFVSDHTLEIEIVERKVINMNYDG